MDALDHKCPSCGAMIPFNPINQKWDCKYCGSQFTLEEMQKYDNASSETANDNKVIDSHIDVYHCSSCGAEVVADEQTTATFCVYCGNTTILKNRLSGNFSPDKVLPFKKVKEDAIKAFKGLSKGRPLMPKLFNDPKNIEKITGVYIPFWTYDYNFSGDIKFRCSDSRTWSDFNYRYTETRIYSVVKNANMNFERVPVDGSSRFKDELMDSIEPFDFDDLLDYNHAYLSGFLAEKYDVESDVADDRAAIRAKNTAIETVRSTIVNHHITTLQDNGLQQKQLKSSYVLLPVWMVNIKYNNKMYTFAMNGQTGKLIGDIPLDKKRVFLFSILIFIITFILSLIFVLITGVR